MKYKRKYLNKKKNLYGGQVVTDRIYQLEESPINLDEYNRFISTIKVIHNGKNYSIKDLLKTKKFIHLGYVYQQGVTKFCSKNLVKLNKHYPITRREHSVGVSILAFHLSRKKYDMTIDEILDDMDAKIYIARHIICGLLHDISHTIFSHVIDFAYDNISYHEDKREEILRKQTDIIEILEAFEHNKYLNISEHIIPDAPVNMTIIKAGRPHINCDRLDYFLRDGYLMGFFTRTQVISVLKCLSVYNEIVCFDDLDTAKLFFDRTYDITVNEWGGKYNITTYNMFAAVVKDAIKKNIIRESDLITKKDDDIYNKLIKTKKYTNIIKTIVNYDYYIYETDTEYMEILCEKDDFIYYKRYIGRIVDPLVKVNNKYKKLSALIKPYYEYKMEQKDKLITHVFFIAEPCERCPAPKFITNIDNTTLPNFTYTIS